jgi:hypothetical protein
LYACHDRLLCFGVFLGDFVVVAPDEFQPEFVE